MEIALVGNPNVGKSLLFNRITGVRVISSNYPGTSVEYTKASVKRDGKEIVFYDLPGTYSLTGVSEDELVATRLLMEKRPERVIAVADATRLSQSLVMIFQLIELGYHVAVALNFMDIARKRYEIDVDLLSRTLRIPIVPIVAQTGEGIDRLIDIVTAPLLPRSNFVVRYDSHTEAFLEDLSQGLVESRNGYPIRGALLKLLEGNKPFEEEFSPSIIALAEEYEVQFRELHGEEIEVHIARDRYGEAGKIASEVLKNKVVKRGMADRISDLTLRPFSGTIILIAVMGGLFLTLIYGGEFIGDLTIRTYVALTSSFFTGLGDFIGGTTGQAIALGIDLSIQGVLGIVIPYIILFYILLGILEDSGYLPRAAILLDGLMRRIGLNGRAIVPMIVGLGCNVPAILSTRVLESRRERLILSTIIVLAVPCSAQTAVILGTVGKYSGLEYALLIFLIEIGFILLLGLLLNRTMKEELPILAMQIPDLLVPSLKNVLSKTYLRAKDFFIVAFPLLLVGSIVLEFLLQYHVLDLLVGPLSPLTVWFLGLPALSIIALIFGVLRRELTVQLLFILFGTADLALFFTPDQFFIFALIMATYAPCLGVLAALVGEFGAKDSMKVFLASLTISLLMGGFAHFILNVI